MQNTRQQMKTVKKALWLIEKKAKQKRNTLREAKLLKLEKVKHKR